MKNSKYRVLLVCDRPVQYATPLLRRHARQPHLDVLVAYCSLRGAVAALDPGYGIEVQWDVPLLDGYEWIALCGEKDAPNTSRRPGLFSKALWRLVRDGDFDAVYVGGYYFREAWAAILAAKWSGIPIILSTDVHGLKSQRAKSKFMQGIKRAVVSRIFRMAGAVNTGSSGATAYVRSLGVAEERILLAGNMVDNGWWTERAADADRDAVRRAWNVPADGVVILFCATLQPWKRPGDLLEAFSRALVPDSYLVFAGEGPLRRALEQRARDLGIAARVRFLGFVNQTGLPEVYAASDLLVLPSEYESFGLVVNEAMLCGCPAVVSDRVGAKYDLVRDGETGYVFPATDVEALADILRTLLGNRGQIARMSAAAKERMKAWTPEMNSNAFARAVQIAAASRKGGRQMQESNQPVVSSEKR
jgi:glycosyltransferase involved in cell wall biosynthesis